MNIFGAEAADGSGRLINKIVMIGFALAGSAIIGVLALDHSTREGTLARWVASKPDSDLSRRLSNLPQSSERGPVGVRYGNIDYMPTATVPAAQQRIKNVVGDPSLGMPN